MHEGLPLIPGSSVYCSYWIQLPTTLAKVTLFKNEGLYFGKVVLDSAKNENGKRGEKKGLV